ncbi:PEP-CTERM sorting domain-containing protein [Massilia sp. ST3]|uniref:PEP-CTERM sorting domain-containing protein n=1 Tax=Massilia sp. ST3 TaxID=2824903 RepID=UPI001B824617|nr:PEP-CTERM sorting domain-containing protein [Massilia sp. ST3]MBQ5948230.1 PEP-CTERM sorting domain-containing protein [Massilia sp. ST3]
MTLLRTLCTAGLACLLAASAQGAVLTYRYTATIDAIVEKDIQTGNYLAPAESAYAGPLIRVGDVVTGILRYNTAAPLAAYQPDPEPRLRTTIYDGAQYDFMSFTVGGATFSFDAGPEAPWSGTSYVRNADGLPDNPAYDVFERIMVRQDGGVRATGHLSLGDVDGTALEDGAMPGRLDPALFELKSLFASFSRAADDGFMVFDSTISSFERVDAQVPEPGVLLLLAAGAGGLFAARRRRSAPQA